MMLSKTKLGLMLLLLPPIVFYACKKYKDPSAAVLDPRLTNHYCNDPDAVNYNWNFPGIADSTVCFYPVDYFKGTWTFHDTVYLPSGDTASTSIKQLVFSSTEDTVKTHLAVTGWCGGNTPFYVTANKYYKAEVDTFPGGPFGQFLCGQSDTLNGSFSKNTFDTINNSMKVDLTINGSGGVTYHRGTAIKQ
jgi:hypothetical protein